MQEEELKVQGIPTNILSVPVFVGSMVGSSAVSLLIGIIIGMICHVKLTMVLASNQDTEKNKETPVSGPIYEEVTAEDQRTAIELTSNMAYEHVSKTT